MSPTSKEQVVCSSHQALYPAVLHREQTPHLGIRGEWCLLGGLPGETCLGLQLLVPSPLSVSYSPATEGKRGQGQLPGETQRSVP